MVLHFAAACCNIINVIMAWVAFLLPALTTNSDDEKPYVSMGVWSTCSQGQNQANGVYTDYTDDYKCLGWNDPRGEGVSGYYYLDGDKRFINVGNLFKAGRGEYTHTPNNISITMGLYTTAIVLMSLGGYTSCCAIGMKKLSYISALCNFLGGIFFLATAIYVFGTNKFGVSDCICNKVNGVMKCSRDGSASTTHFCSGWNYSAIYLWIAWLLCWMCAGMSGGHGNSGDKEPKKEEEHHDDEGATTGKI
jgi:hypothetical protein